MAQSWKPIEYKFILLGDSSVGKSSIYSRLSGNSFKSNIMMTTGIEKIELNFDDVQIDEKKKQTFKIILFDTVGQERYRAITRSYFKDSQGIVLIYSIVDKSSFEHVQTWLDSIKDSLSDWKGAGYMVMLLGNKLDIAEEHEEERKIPAEEAEKLCLENGIYWGGECSAKTFDENQLREIFQNLLKQIYLKLRTNDNNNRKNANIISINKETNKKSKTSCCGGESSNLKNKKKDK